VSLSLGLSAVIFYVATLIYITGEQISEVKQAGSSRASSIRGGGEGASSSPAAAAADVGKEERMKTAGGAGSPALGNKPVSGAEDTKGGMCRGVTGSEEGYWTTDGSGFRYNIKGCKLKRFDRDMARKCLRNRSESHQHQTTDNRQQTTDNRQQTTDNRQQTTDNRQQTTCRTCGRTPSPELGERENHCRKEGGG
jgi:hypothetical protein